MSPLPRENGRTPVAYVSGANFLSRSFIGFPHKPSYSASFLHWIFLLSYPYSITLYISEEYLNKASVIADTVSPSNSLDQPGLDLGSLLLFYTTMNHFLIRLWRVMKSGLYMITGGNKLSGWSKKKLQSIFLDQTCTKKTSWSLFGGLLLVWLTTAFWIPVKPLHLRSVFSKSMRCTENCNTCSWHWSAERAQFNQRSNCQHPVDHWKSKRVPEKIYFCFID